MSAGILILRPQPGADETAERAARTGLAAVVAPLFEIEPVHWEPPDPAGFDAVMVTSANAVRHAGDALTSFLAFPCYAVGEASAAAASAFGFGDVRTGPADGTALAERMEQDGIERAFHPCGEHRAAIATTVSIRAVAVYAARPAAALAPAAEDALARGALVLLHSPRAAMHFAGLCPLPRSEVRIAAISEKAAIAAGPGWREIAIAAEPRDHALLELAAKLCQKAGG